MFYEGEENNCGSKERTVKYIDELITTKILKVSGFYEHHAIAIIKKFHIKKFHEGTAVESLLMLKQQMKNF